ncbi:putative myosin-binding protein 5 [Silene latifolia]|uniref:putative myosin-binding protein 5 n=1 Tax=Silene latifolia TaxID=37657 RepID=UPI003D78AC13
MTSGREFRHFVEEELGKFPHFVIYAILEWTLIGILFLDGFLAFVSSEFAEYFDLRPPCVLCTRIDHILMRKKLRYCYNESICEGHKRDLSSLAYCHVHRKLSDIKRMCEGCLLSFATDKTDNKSDKSDGEAYKSLNNGGMNKDIGVFDEEIRARLKLQPYGPVEAAPGGEKPANGAGNVVLCSCCGEPMKVKSSGYQKSNTMSNSNSNSNNNSSNNVVSSTFQRVPSRLSQQAPAPSPRAPFGAWRADEARATLELSSIRCTELKMADSTGLLEDEDKGNPMTPALREETRAATMPLPTEQPDDLNLEEAGRTPTFARGNRFFNITDSAASSPRWANRMPRKSLLDRVELASDPVEAIAGSETNTEVLLNRLKNQVRMDKKSLIALYMELDEERSASAVAANNAMAMITRLQAEKAAAQMEQLQYQRMMEEQAEYDQEAIQMLKEFLAKREDEIKDLEAEIDIYRFRYGDPDVCRGDHLEKSQSFSSITDHGSPLFSIVATDTEMDVHDDQVSDSSSNKEGDDNDNDNDDVDHNVGDGDNYDAVHIVGDGDNYDADHSVGDGDNGDVSSSIDMEQEELSHESAMSFGI